MSHHPSSAELAAFRRSIAYNRDGQAHATALAFGYVPRAIGVKAPGQWHAPTLPHDGTRPEELQRGIGYGDGRTGRGYIASGYVDARREASALRSRAYARMDYCACQHPDRHYGNLPCRVTPESSGIPLGPNGYCWSCWSAKHDQTIPTDTWTEDEPHSPLPIRYQPSFIITR